MLITQIFHSFFFIMLTYVMYLKYNNKNILRPILVYFLLVIYLISLFIINYSFNYLSNKLLVFLLFFSFSPILLNLMGKWVNVFEKNKELLKYPELRNNILSIKKIILYKLIFVLLLIYQLLLIWVSVIFKNIQNGK